jgi:hypothetical protein
MFELFKKTDEEKNLDKNADKQKLVMSSSSDTAMASLDPPSTLPELAKDLYEKEEEKKSTVNEPVESVKLSESKIPKISMNNIPKITFPTVSLEPNKDNVPQLDMDLIKSHTVPREEHRIITKPLSSQTSQANNYVDSTDSFLSLLNNKIEGGFFKEFQDFIVQNTLNDTSKRNILEDLLGKDLVEKMVLYHSTRDSELPFYLSNNELTATTRHKFEELQNLEHSWISTKQKLDILKKLNNTFEVDIKLKSEELKGLLKETLKRSDGVSPSVNTQNISTNSNTMKNAIDVVNNNQDTTDVHKNAFSIMTYAVDPSKYFYMHDGRVLKSLFDLVDALKNIDDNTFYHHVNTQRNDFSNWINGVFEHHILAEHIKNIRNKHELLEFFKNNTY